MTPQANQSGDSSAFCCPRKEPARAARPEAPSRGLRLPDQLDDAALLRVLQRPLARPNSSFQGFDGFPVRVVLRKIG